MKQEITESIWDDGINIIPMAEVSHIIRKKDGVWIIFKHSKTNPNLKTVLKLEPSVWLGVDKKSKEFIISKDGIVPLPEAKQENEDKAGTLPYTHPIYTEVSQLDKYDSIEYILKYYTLTKKQ